MNAGRKGLLPIILGVFAMVFTFVTINTIIDVYDYYVDLIAEIKEYGMEGENVSSLIFAGVYNLFDVSMLITLLIISIVQFIKSLVNINSINFTVKGIGLILLMFSIRTMGLIFILIADLSYFLEEFSIEYINKFELVMAIILFITSVLTLGLKLIGKYVFLIGSSIILMVISVYSLSKYDYLSTSYYMAYIMFVFEGTFGILISVFSIRADNIIVVRKEDINAIMNENNNNKEDAGYYSNNKEEIDDIFKDEDIIIPKKNNDNNQNNNNNRFNFKDANGKEKGFMIAGLSCCLLGTVFGIILAITMTGIIIWLIMALLLLGLALIFFLSATTSYKNRKNKK